MSRRTAPAIAPSRTPERKRERRAVRQFLRIATVLNATPRTSPEYGDLAAAFDAANVALARIPKYPIEEND